MAVSLSFVTGPAATPTVTLALNQPGMSVLAESFSLGAPSFDGEPGSVGGSYGYRTVEFRLQFTGTYAEAATLAQDVAQQLALGGADQPNRRNWLMFRFSPSDPVMFLHTYPTSFDSLEWRQSGVGVWELPVSIVCDYDMVGPPVDIASFTITNDPTTGTNRMMVGPSTVTELGAIKGDLETPLLLAQTSGPGVSRAFWDPRTLGLVEYLSTYALSSGTHTFLARDLTELTSGTDTGATVSAAGANYVGGNYKQSTFATNTNLVVRLSGAFSTTLNLMPGSYRVVMRVVTPSTATGSGGYTAQFALGVKVDGSTTYDYLPTVLVPLGVDGGSADMGGLVDLGIMPVPMGSPPGPAGLAPAATQSRPLDIAIKATTFSSTKPLRFDEIYFLPVETNYGEASTALIQPTGWNASAPHNVLLFDGVNTQMRPLYDSTGTAPFAGVPVPAITQSLVTPIAYVGGLPTVRPGWNNYLQYIYEETTVGGTAAFTARYYPRYLHIRPAST